MPKAKRVCQSLVPRVPAVPKPKPAPKPKPVLKRQVTSPARVLLPEPTPGLTDSIMSFVRGYILEHGFPRDGDLTQVMRSTVSYFLDYAWTNHDSGHNSVLSFYFDAQGNVIEIVMYRDDNTRGEVLL